MSEEKRARVGDNNSSAELQIAAMIAILRDFTPEQRAEFRRQFFEIGKRTVRVAHSIGWEGFRLSPEACEELSRMGYSDEQVRQMSHGAPTRDPTDTGHWKWRHDPGLLRVVEKMIRGNTHHLKIGEVQLREGEQFKVEDYDGRERILAQFP